MKRCGLLVVTASTLLLTVIVLSRAAAGHAEAANFSRARGVFRGETAMHYRQAQPTHWRAYLLQH